MSKTDIKGHTSPNMLRIPSVFSLREPGPLELGQYGNCITGTFQSKTRLGTLKHSLMTSGLKYFGFPVFLCNGVFNPGEQSRGERMETSPTPDWCHHTLAASLPGLKNLSMKQTIGPRISQPGIRLGTLAVLRRVPV